jgi:hypothetical protein
MNLKLSFDDVKKVVQNKPGHHWWEGVYNPFLYGIRSRSLVADLWNDTLGVCYIDHYGNKINLMHKGSTKPGLNWLKDKMGNVNGTAILPEGQYLKCWKLGEHNGSYVALVQAGPKVFKVYRDNNKDGRFDFQGPLYDDVAGLNMHTESLLKDSEKVGLYSAGCQVRAYDREHFLTISICQMSVPLYGGLFSYTLLNERDFLPD